MAIEQWGFSSVPHLLCYVASVYYGHLHGPVTLTPNASVWQWSWHYLFCDSDLSRLGFDPTFHLRGERSSLLRHRSGPIYALLGFYLYCTTGDKESLLKNDKCFKNVTHTVLLDSQRYFRNADYEIKALEKILNVLLLY